MQIELIRCFKRKLQKRAVIGPFSKLADPAAIEIMGRAGFDFVIIDMEHGPNSVQTVQNLIRAAETSGILPIVRIAENSEANIGAVLDIGAGGIQVPQVTSAAEAEKAVCAARFAPKGMRGICKFVRAAQYSALDRLKYFKQANEALVILQIEGHEGIEALDDIIRVNGIDIIFIGLMDLSQSLGVAGHMDHPRVIKRLKEICNACKKVKMTVGTYADTPQIGLKWTRLGARYIGCNVDVGILLEACRNMVSDFKIKRKRT